MKQTNQFTYKLNIIKLGAAEFQLKLYVDRSVFRKVTVLFLVVKLETLN